MLNPAVNGKIQGLFKAFDCFSSTFQGKFNFQGLSKTVLYIQVLFKPVRTLGLIGKTTALRIKSKIYTTNTGIMKLSDFVFSLSKAVFCLFSIL